MPGGRLTQQERQRIAAGLADRLSYAEIARRLHRPTSTISREVARNGGPGDYRPQQAQRATARRARRGTPAPPRASTPPDHTMEELVELAVRSGLPRTMARVHIDLLLAEDGRRTAAELTRRLQVSPASISVAVNYLVEQGYVRRERDPERRRDIYVVDDAAWYNSMLINSWQTLEVARASIVAGENLGLDTPVGQRLAKAGTFLERVIVDAIASADRWRHLLE